MLLHIRAQPRLGKADLLLAARLAQIHHLGVRAGDRVTGPAVIVERETSTMVTATFDAVMQSDGGILLVRKEIGA